jgi:hypothetical protein
LARKSKRKSMRTLSTLLGIAVLGFLTAAVIQYRHDDLTTAVHLLGWMFALLAVLVGFTWPTRCRVETSLRKPCRNEAYGFLFGCWRASHHLEKFLVRVRLERAITQSAQREVAARSSASTLEMPAEASAIKVSVENDAMSILGFWVGLLSAVTGIAQVVIAVH